MLPSMLDGNSPPLVAIIGASAVAFVALYLANGIRPMTTVALISTLGALAITVGLATLFTNLAHFTGAANEDALLVGLGTSAIDLKGLVLAGMVLGALGALNDITVTQASAVGELRTAQPELSRRDLYRSGLRIGRDHISSTVNTLALGLRGRVAPAAPPLHPVGAEPGERRERRDRRGGDRVRARGQHRARGRGADLHVVRVAGGHRALALSHGAGRAGGRARPVVCSASKPVAPVAPHAERCRTRRRRPLAPRDERDFWVRAERLRGGHPAEQRRVTSAARRRGNWD